MTRSRARPAPPLMVAADPEDDDLVAEVVEEPDGAHEPLAEAPAAEEPLMPAPEPPASTWRATLDRENSRHGRLLTLKFSAESVPTREAHAAGMVAGLGGAVKAAVPSLESFQALVALSQSAAANPGFCLLFSGTLASLRQRAEEDVGTAIARESGVMSDDLHRRRADIVAGIAKKVADDLDEMAALERALALLGEQRRLKAGVEELLDEALAAAGAPATKDGPAGAA